MKKDISLIVYDDIKNDQLKKNWRLLQHKTKCFPQLYYEWCEPWWRYRSGGRKLHIVTVFDHNNIIIGLAPLCIEKQLTIKILKSFPIHFADFYSFIIDKNKFDEVVEKIIEYLRTFKSWHVVQLSKINKSEPLWRILSSNKSFKHKLMSKVYIADFTTIVSDNYLSYLSKNIQKKYIRSIKKIKEIGNLTLKCIEDNDSFNSYHTNLKEMYDIRWKNDYVKTPGEDYYLLEQEAVSGLFKNNKIILFLLKLDNLIIAYRWGIVNKDVYYAWKVCHHPEYNKFSPGTMILGMVMHELITRGFNKFNFGPGHYDWKKNWSTPKAESAIYEFFGSSGSLKSRFYIIFRLKYRDRIKCFYQCLLNYSLLKKVNRMLRSSK